jgi:hypothetical protein
VQLAIDTRSVGRRFPSNYAGLSYELAELTEPEMFTASNKQLVALFRQLSPNGVLRLGGNSSESCWFKADPATAAPTLRAPPGNLSENWMPHTLFEITPQAIDALAGFLKATGWQLIYGINLGNNTPERAAAEAKYVARAVGSHLLFFQIGNEPDFYHDANNATRPPNWRFADYLREWTGMAQAILQAVPDARFGGPDVGASSDWITSFISEAPEKLGSRVVAVTGHYYAEGPPDNPSVTISRLLRPDAKGLRRAKATVDAAAQNHLVYRMTEGNSCYRGGKPGLSDAFASALWAADYMLSLAAAGGAGVNFHGGSAQMLRKSLGNHMPGAAQTQSVQRPSTQGGFYTPIAGEPATGFIARPVFYGMFFANQFAGTQLVATEFSAGKINTTAYAAKKDSAILVAIINKSESNDIRVRFKTQPLSRSKILRLSGPAFNSTSGITLGGSEISADHSWFAAHFDSPAPNSQVVNVPHASAALVVLE